jgi:formylglycine-generating enzyme required for sulfatase activity/pimeloyl-ACP methyl ester carboxylesterase
MLLPLMALPAAARDLVPVPAASFQVTDAATGIPTVVVVDAFLISPAEVTQAEFERTMGYNPSVHRGANRPVENVTWWEAIRYCNLRSLAEGLQPCYDLASGRCDLTRTGYRLPTDAEWSRALGEPPDPKQIALFARLGSDDTKSAALLVEAARARGTAEIGTLRPNALGLYDMLGNVWEWCNDLYNPSATPSPAHNPAGAARGVARIVRGGSFISTISRWARGYRSSMEPGRRSRFTGFRVCRTGAQQPAAPVAADWDAVYNQAPPGFEASIGTLKPLTAGGLEQWKTQRGALYEKWQKVLGAPTVAPPPPAAKLVEVVREQNYTGRLMYFQVEPDFWEKIFILAPASAAARPLPVVIVPYYDVDVPAGKNLGGKTFLPPGTRSFAYLAAQQGWIAVAVRWFGESYGEGYSEAVANLKLRHPRSTGLGKWVWDARRLLDYLYTLPEVDRTRIGIIGHSLGGKMALYAAAMEPRITAVVASEPGIGLRFSNYDDFWYLGESIRSLDAGADHHELLGLIAPRPFLLIGGESADKDESWHYINAARAVYTLYGKPRSIGYLNHRSGHSPTPDAVRLAIEWLKRYQ